MTASASTTDALLRFEVTEIYDGDDEKLKLTALSSRAIACR